MNIQVQTCNETVTLFRHSANRSGDAYTPVVIHGASWYGGKSIELIDNGANNHFSLSVRIPQRRIRAGVIPAEGDFIARGDLSGKVTLTDIVNSGAIRIRSVRDNCRGSRPHWRLLA